MKKIILLALSVGLMFGACSKDFLELSATDTISKSDIDKVSENSPHLGAATLNGLYAYNVRAFSGGTTGHDDFGQKGFDIYTDMLAGDVNLNSAIYGWYSRIANLQNITNFTSNENYKPWRFYYYMVRGTNNVIAPYDGKELNNTEKKVLAEAKALRAYMYYNLAVMYTKGYDANEKLLPIYEAPVLENLPAKTTQEVFDFMIKDLNESIQLFEEAGAVGKEKNVNYLVTKGILAYVYAAKGTNDALIEAGKLTDDIILSGAYPLASKNGLLAGFNKMSSNPNWMWGAVLTSENNLDLVSWWGQMDVYTYSYAYVGDTKGMSTELYKAISDKDVRKQQFVSNIVTDVTGEEMKIGKENTVPANKFYSAKGKLFGGQRIIESDYVFMRVEEMYLLNAEVKARLGQEAAAKEILKEFLAVRVADVTFVDNLSGNNLKEQILLQTRIELWGEGKAYAAIKRNKADFNYGSNHLYFANTNFSYDDSKMTFMVPQNEILNNPVYNN